MKRFSVYQIDTEYISELSETDENVRKISKNPPLVGIVADICGKQYFIPFSAPKPKHSQMNNDIDFTKMTDDGKLIGVLNFNNMVPVNDSVILPLNTDIEENDDVRYKKMVMKQLDWCQKNHESIIAKACKLYKMVTETPEKNILITRRCCDFKKLEKALEKKQNSALS